MDMIEEYGVWVIIWSIFWVERKGEVKLVVKVCWLCWGFYWIGGGDFYLEVN